MLDQGTEGVNSDNGTGDYSQAGFGDSISMRWITLQTHNRGSWHAGPVEEASTEVKAVPEEGLRRPLGGSRGRASCSR